VRPVLTVLLLTTGILFPAATASAVAEPGVGIRLLEAPTDRRDDPRASNYIIDHLPPGASITRRVEVSNGTSQRVPIKVYAGPAELKEGSFEPLPENETNELTTWTTVSPTEMVLPPGQAQPATVTISVPPDASPGERYAAVWAQLSSAPGGGGVTQVSRVGIRIYLSVGPGGEPASDFAIDSVTAERDSNGTPVVKAQVRNTGGRALDLAGELALTEGPGGLSGGPFTAEIGTTLAVDQSAPVTVLLDEELPNGPWKATLSLKSGLLERSASAEITFPDAGAEGRTVPVEKAKSGGSGPLIAWVLAALLLLGAILVFVMRRRFKS
jgi:hypothetical protein